MGTRGRTPQGRYWLLTVPHALFTPYLPPGVAYIKGQLECGDGGFLHWQILVLCSAKRTGKWMRDTFGPVHHELTRSSAADEYVWKEETRVEGTQFELGERPLRRNVKADWERVWKLAQEASIETVEANVRVQHYRTLRTISADYAKPVGMVRTCYVYWGATGTGKSRRAWEEAGLDAYPKDPRTKWWDGYTGQRNVVVDEFRGTIDVAHLLRWLDRYPALS